MNTYWKLGLYAGVALTLLLAGWHARVIWDDAHEAKVQRRQIEDHARTEQIANQGAADYEKQKQALETQIYDLKQNLSRARRGAAAPCLVPGDVLRAIDAAACERARWRHHSFLFLVIDGTCLRRSELLSRRRQVDPVTIALSV